MKNMGKLENLPSTIPPPHTRKNCKSRTRKFEEFYSQAVENLTGKSREETGRIIKKFYVWPKEKRHRENTCRNMAANPIRFLKHFRTEPNYRKSSRIYRNVSTTRNHRASISIKGSRCVRRL